MRACNRGKASWQIAECFGLSECCGISVFHTLAGAEVADEDATTTPAELSEALLEVPEVTLQAFAGLLAEDNGPEWEVSLTVVETAPKGKSTGARAKGDTPCSSLYKALSLVLIFRLCYWICTPLKAIGSLAKLICAV